MKSNLSILVIDDDKFHLDILVSKLKSLKYSNLRLANSFSEATNSLMESMPDIIIWTIIKQLLTFLKMSI